MNPAQTIIEKLGGDSAVARLLRENGYPCHVSSVVRWRLPKERGGCDGLIPSSRIQQLLRIAGNQGLILAPEDFFMTNL